MSFSGRVWEVGGKDGAVTTAHAREWADGGEEGFPAGPAPGGRLRGRAGPGSGGNGCLVPGSLARPPGTPLPRRVGLGWAELTQLFLWGWSSWDTSGVGCQRS